MPEMNPLLQGIKLPGRIFQLPSKGLFYKNGELSDDIKEGEIHVKAMSAMDEIIMKNPDQLFSGDAVKTVFAKCIDGVLKPTELLSKDIDAIMVFLRSVTYGPSYEYMAHHNCEGAKDHNYVADTETMITTMKYLDATVLEENFQVITSTGQKVNLRPNRYDQVLDMIKANQNKNEMTAEDQKRNLKMMLIGVIESIDGINDPALIAEWIDNVPTKTVNKIAMKVESIGAWGIDMVVKPKCKDCGAEFDVSIPINPVSFFTE